MKDANVPVYVRRQADADAVFFGRFVIGDLEELVGAFPFWGCFDGEDAREGVFGQFFIDKRGRAGFEIVVGDME